MNNSTPGHGSFIGRERRCRPAGSHVSLVPHLPSVECGRTAFVCLFHHHSWNWGQGQLFFRSNVVTFCYRCGSGSNEDSGDFGALGGRLSSTETAEKSRFFKNVPILCSYLGLSPHRCWLRLDTYFIWSFIGPATLIIMVSTTPATSSAH